MAILNTTHPTARKEHICNFCGGAIKVGEKYDRLIIENDGTVYTWKQHQSCEAAAQLLDMYDDCGDEGLTQNEFSENIWQYVQDEHYDRETQAIEEDWSGLTLQEAVLKVVEERTRQEDEVKAFEEQVRLNEPDIDDWTPEQGQTVWLFPSNTKSDYTQGVIKMMGSDFFYVSGRDFAYRKFHKKSKKESTLGTIGFARYGRTHCYSSEEIIKRMLNKEKAIKNE